MKPDKRERTVYIDYLRVSAIFAVIMIHVSCQIWYKADVNGFQWQTSNFFDSLSRWGVPVFVMISGSLFLGRDIPVRELYSKYILRLAIAYIMWSLFYALIFTGGSVKQVFLKTITGHYHMWFILTIIGLYMCTPLLRLLVDKGWKTRYFLVLAFIFAFVFPVIISLSNDFGNESIVNTANAIAYADSRMNMDLVMGYSGYYVLGYCLNRTELNEHQRRLVYSLGLIGFFFTAIITSVVSVKMQTYCTKYFDFITVNVLFESMAVFTAFKHAHFQNATINRIMQKMAKCCFGAYLIHVFVIEMFSNLLGLNTYSFNPVLSIIVITIITFILSFGISAVLNRIPVVRKYIV